MHVGVCKGALQFPIEQVMNHDIQCFRDFYKAGLAFNQYEVGVLVFFSEHNVSVTTHTCYCYFLKCLLGYC